MKYLLQENVIYETYFLKKKKNSIFGCNFENDPKKNI